MSQSPSDPQSPSPLKTIYLMFATHLDIGYTAPPDRLELQHKQQLDEVLELCRMYPTYHYTIEATWVMRQWLKRTDDPRRIREMVRRIHEGRVEICAPFGSMHSSVMAPEQTNQLCYDARRIQEELGVEIVTAMQNDVPGYSWAYPQVLRKSGMKYLYVGINDSLGGGLAIKPQTKPIYWDGIDGSRILLQTNHLYTLHHPKILDWFWMRDGSMEKTLQDMDGLFEGNPCDSVLILASPGDNKGPLENIYIFERIMEWNQMPDRPYRVEAGTPRKYFEHIEKQFGNQLEVWHGDWPATFEWDLTKVRAPQATTAYRHAQTHLPTVEKLLAIDTVTKGTDFPRYDVAQAYEELLNYGEHTAPEGHATPALTRREILWSNHVHFFNAYRALNMAEGLYPRTQLRLGLPPGEDRIIVFNPLSWPRTETVRVPTPMFQDIKFEFCQQPVRSLIDMESGEIITVDHDERSEWRRESVGDDRMPCVSFLAKNIPPFGIRTYKVVKDEQADASKPLTQAVQSGGHTIENDKYYVELDPITGDIACIIDRELKHEIVGGQMNNGQPAIFNAFTSATLGPSITVSIQKLVGKTFEKLVIQRPGSWFPRTEIRLDRRAAQVEVRNHFDREAWKRQHPLESVMEGRLHFPLRVSPEKAHVVVSGPNGFRRIPEDIMPGAPVDSWPSSAFISVDDGKTCIMISSPSDYLFRPGKAKGDFFDMHTQTIWQAFNVVNRSGGKQILPYTDPTEEDVVVHEYAITSHPGSFNAVAAQQFGWNFRTEMIGFYTVKTEGEDDYGGLYPIPYGILFRMLKPFSKFGKPAASLIRISGLDNSNCLVNIQAFRQSLFPRRNYMILRLQEMVGAECQSIRVEFAPELKLKSAFMADMVERKGGKIKVSKNGFQTDIGPFETLTLALTF